MKGQNLLRLMLLLMVGMGGCGQRSPKPPRAAATPVASPPMIGYEVRSVGQSQVHIVVIPLGRAFTIKPALADGVDTVERLAKQNQAIAAINGGYFDPVNQKSASFVTLKGRVIANPQNNERLINNQQLAPYLSRILDRAAFRRYQCNKETRYDIAAGSQSAPVGCDLIDELGAGPLLLPQIQLEQEAFVELSGGVVVRDPLGSEQPNARSAVGVKADGSVIWVLVAQRSEEPYRSGMSLPMLASFMKSLGAVKAMNLDGGTSSALYFQGKVHYGKVNAAGDRVWRPIKSILLVQAGKT
jgi:hypothetical protein